MSMTKTIGSRIRTYVPRRLRPYDRTMLLLKIFGAPIAAGAAVIALIGFTQGPIGLHSTVDDHGRVTVVDSHR